MASCRQFWVGPHAASQTAHTFMFAESNSDSYTLSHTHIHKHIRHATLPGDLWLEPAALTQQYINHWPLSSTAGPQCHAELDSTGIKVRNWIQKLIQARDNCWHTEVLEVLIPPCDNMLSVMRPLTSAVRPARCYWSENRETGEWVSRWGKGGDEDITCQVALILGLATRFFKYASQNTHTQICGYCVLKYFDFMLLYTSHPLLFRRIYCTYLL